MLTKSGSLVLGKFLAAAERDLQRADEHLAAANAEARQALKNYEALKIQVAELMEDVERHASEG